MTIHFCQNLSATGEYEGLDPSMVLFQYQPFGEAANYFSYNLHTA
jgi:hypothetical protein